MIITLMIKIAWMSINAKFIFMIMMIMQIPLLLMIVLFASMGTTVIILTSLSSACGDKCCIGLSSARGSGLSICKIQRIRKSICWSG